MEGERDVGDDVAVLEGDRRGPPSGGEVAADAHDAAPDGPSGRRPPRWAAAILVAIARQAPWRTASAVTAVLAAMLVVDRVDSGGMLQHDPLLRLFAVVLCLPVAFVFEEAASGVCDATPTGAEPRRWVRGLFAVTVAAGCWLLATARMAPSDPRLVHRQFAAALTVAVAVALVAGRTERTGGGTPAAIGAALVVIGSIVTLGRLGPDRVTTALDVLLALAVAVAFVAGRDPGRAGLRHVLRRSSDDDRHHR